MQIKTTVNSHWTGISLKVRTLILGKDVEKWEPHTASGKINYEMMTGTPYSYYGK